MKKRLKAWVILSLSAVLCAFLGLIGCSKQPEGETVDYTPVYGAYYCELDEGEEYRLVLSQGGYVWVAAGKTETGTYRYDGEKLYFAFADTQTETSASVENNVLSVTYKGSAYRLYKEVGYTVSYVADGETTSVNVINGKSAAKPSDPQKDGNLFVGWYSDEAYTKPYDFATPVTSDVTLYACFTEGDANDAEYTVTFISEGATLQTKQTIGGKAFDLPVPTGDKTFIGWWVSDYQSASKLTYKYGGEVLTADTDFYAVWAEDGKTSVSVSAEGVTWDSVGVNASYSVKITAPDGSAATPVTVGSTTYAYDFASKAAGDYVVEVTVNGNTATAYYKNKALARVSSFKVIEPSVLLFSPVENAQKYYITVDCGEEGHNHIRVDNGSSVYFNFANCAMQPGGIEFTVEAAAAGYASSVAHYTVNRELQTATNLKIDAATDEVSWNAVENAAEYIVKITTANGTDTVNVGAATKYSLKNYDAGTVSVEVTAQTKGYNSSEAANVSYTKTAIATPSNIKVKNNVVTWDAVSGATAYKIKVGAVEKTVTANAEDTTVSFTLTNEVLTDAGTYAVSVKAVAATESASSAYSEALIVNYNTQTAVRYAGGTAIWTPVADAAKYVVNVNGFNVATVTNGDFSAAITLTQRGANSITITCYNAQGEVIGSGSTEAYAYSVIFDSRGGAAVETQYKAVGDPITLPDCERTGNELVGWYNLPGGVSNNGALYADKVFCETTDLLLYAGWKVETYSVVLDLGELADETVHYGEVAYQRNYVIEAPVTHPDAAKAFAGWYSQPNAQGTRYTDQYGVSLSDWEYSYGRTFYAAWVTVFTFNDIDNGANYSVSKGDDIDMVVEVTVPVEYKGKPVTTVEGSGFQLSTKLVTVNIPDTIKSVETGTAFAGCSALYNINVYETDSNDKGSYFSEDGILIKDNVNNGVELAYFPKGRGGVVVIPDVVETLPVSIFSSSSLTEVTIPASVTKIDAKAFYYSRKLTKVTFAAPAENETAKPLTIDSEAFKNCVLLKSVDLPSRLTSFNSNVFSGCTVLSIVNIDGTGGTYTSKEGVLCNADGTQIVFCPVGRTGAYTIPAGVNSIGASAFKGCNKLTSLVVPGYVTEIGKDAFSACTGLTSLVFEGDKNNAKLTIGEAAFYGCTKLTEVTLPANLSAVSKNAFGMTSQLTKVTLDCGEDIAIDTAAFINVTDKTTPAQYFVTTLEIGKNVGVVDIGGIFGTSLSSVKVDPENTNYKEIDSVLFNNDVSRILYYPKARTGEYSIPATVTEIGAGVFESRKISKITINKNIVLIGEKAFFECENLAEVVFEDGGTENLVIGANAFAKTAITQMALPARVSEFGASAFAGCAELTSVNIPANIQALPDGLFDGCAKLASVDVPAAVNLIATDGDGAQTVFTGCASLTAINVAPENAKYASVNGVLYAKNESGVNTTLVYCPISNTPNAGQANEGEFTIPAEVTKVASGAFADNSGVKKLQFACVTAENLSFGKNVFDGCVGLEEVILPSGLTDITEAMFANCASIQHVFIPNTVKTLGHMAFYKCTALSNVEFEAGNTSNPLVIADGSEVGGPPSYYGVFVGCRSLREISFPERTTVIGSYAFSIVDVKQGPYREEVANGITTVNIPSTVTEIKNKAFYYAQVVTVNIAPNSQLTKIGQEAFYSAYSTKPTTPSTAKLTSFTLPASVETIDAMAFYGCGALTNFTIESGSKLKTIGIAAFYGCVNLPSFTVPATVETIGENAFYNAAKMESFTFENGSVIKDIGNKAFEKCVALTSFAFPEVVGGEIKAGKTIFNGCTGLKKVTISSSLLSPTTVLSGCSSVEDIILNNNKVQLTNNSMMSVDGTEIYYVLAKAEGEYVIPDTVATIGAYVFDGKTKITKVTIPATVTKIDQYAFRNCTGLQQVTFTEGSQLTTLGQYAFAGCVSLTAITLPDTVTTLGNYIFSGCTNLSSVDLPQTLTTLGNYVFADCTSLSSIELPETITSMGNYVFSGCTSLSSIELPETLTKIGTYLFKNCTSMVGIRIPSRLTSLNANMFEGCSSLTSVTFGGNVTQFGSYVFKNCTSLKTFTVPNTVTKLGTYSFYGCTALESVTLPSNLTAIPNGCFFGCSALKTLDVPVTVRSLGTSAFEGCSSIDNLVFTPNMTLGSGTATTSTCSVFKNCTSLSNLVFKGTINYVGRQCFMNCTSLKTVDLTGVTVIGSEAFSGSGLESITIPATVKTIYPGSDKYPTTYYGGAFSHCDKLTQVVVDERSQYFKVNSQGLVTNIDETEVVFCPVNISGELTFEKGVTFYANAFDGCKLLTKVVLPSDLTKITSGLFYNCSSLTTIEIPSSVKEIYMYAFSGCTALTEVDIPDSVTTIGQYAFRDCTLLTSVTLHDGLTKIDNYAFIGCTSLANIIIPDTVTTLGNGAFSGCTNLTGVTIGEGVKALNIGVFKDCTSLTEITLPETVTSVKEATFEGCTITVHVPYASAEDLPEGLKPLLTTTKATITVVYDKAVNE